MIEPITTAVQEITIDSNRILHHTEADLIDRRIPNVIRLVQYDDTLPVIAVDLKSGGVTYALPEGAACNIRIRKPDNTIVYNPALGCDASRSVVYFEVTPQVGVVVGELQTVLEVYLSGKTAGTSPLRIVVENNPIKVDDYESMDEVQTITHLVGEAEEARDEAVAAAETAAHDAAEEVADDIFKTLAPYEATTTASQAYSVGDYLGYDGKLYRVTTAISSGGTIIPDTNVVETDVTTEIKAIPAVEAFEALATYEGTTTASQAYAIGNYLVYNNTLYRVTSAISQGGTITPDTNVIKTDVATEIISLKARVADLESELGKKTLWWASQAISSTSGSSGTLATITDSKITADHILTKFVPADGSKITSDISCNTSAGQAVITGISIAATTAEIVLEMKDN